MLHFRVQACDKVPKEHLKTACGNALYTSKTVQNEMITICGSIIWKEAPRDDPNAGFFSVIADEATEAANDEQLSICVCFFDIAHLVRSSWLSMNVILESLVKPLLMTFVEWQLRFQLLCSQAYDGAGAMTRKSKGVASRILSKYPKVLYMHCAAHKLNLCEMKCCSIQEVSNMMQTADKILRFFSNSSKRQLPLEKWIDDVLPEEN